MRTMLAVLGASVAVSGCKTEESTPPTAASADNQEVSAVEVAPLPKAGAEVIREYFEWVSEYRKTPSEVSERHDCYGQGDPQEGFCQSGTTRGDDAWSVSWRERDPSAVEFESGPLDVGVEVTCAALGAKPVRRWKWANVGILSHCILGSKYPGLEGLHVWIKNGKRGTRLHVFSDSYLEKAPYDFAEVIKTQGETLPAK